MHVKAFGLMTRHPVKVEALPEDLRDVMPVDERGRVDRPPRELRAEVFRRFSPRSSRCAMTGKLGGILLQFPSYVVHKPVSLEYIEWAQEQLPGDELLSSSATGAGSTRSTGPRRSRSSRVAA